MLRGVAGYTDLAMLRQGLQQAMALAAQGQILCPEVELPL
jgi:hypothetical protein